jgi:putative acetyltransferase
MNLSLAIAPVNPTNSAIVELVTELDEYLNPLYPPESRHGLNLAALSHESVTIFLASLANEPVGCGAIKRFATDYAEIKRMYVRPTCRGKGIGKQILNQLEAQAKSENINKLRLETGIHQLNAIALYQKCGFYEIPPFGNYKPDSLSRFFEKSLARSHSLGCL